jgi:hypothetical protein
LVFAALKHPELEVELDPLPVHTWSAFGIPPQPSFILRVPLPREWPREEVPLVSQDAIPEAVPMTVLYGLVLGPRKIPLARARVELPNLYRSTYTDAKGRFSLLGVPAAPKSKTLLIRARGQEQVTTVAATGTLEQPIVIDLLFDKEA